MVLKRIFGEEGEEDDGSFVHQSKRPRPGLSAMREVMGAQCMQRHLSKLEPFLRRVVQEEVENVLCRFVHAAPRLPMNRIQVAVSRQYRLHFQNSLPHTLFTGSRIEAEGRVPVQLVIIDSDSNKVITSGPLSSIKIEILVLDGDFGGDGQEEWTEKEFGDSVVREREGKRPLLTGELVMALNDGVGYLSDATFTDNSSWIRSRKFRLGARIYQSKCIEERVQEAVSEAFLVKDHRGELYKKHHPPSLDDDVWRLEKIGKDGAFHRRLAENRINTVQDFLRNLVVDQDRLRSILGNGMSNKIWEATIEHAKECVLDERFYSYCDQGAVLLFNSIFQLVGAMIDNVYHSLEELDASQKAIVNKAKQLAFECPTDIIELNPTDTLPKHLPANSVSVLGSSCSMLPSSPHQAKQLCSLPQSSVPCNELLYPSQLKDHFSGQNFNPGQCFASSHTNNFNTKDILDMPFANIPTGGLAGPMNSSDRVMGYSPDIDMLHSSPYPMLWDHGNRLVPSSGTESSIGDFIPHVDGTNSRSSSGKWVKLVAALKRMAISKRLAARKARIMNLSYPTTATSMCSDAHAGWQLISDEEDAFIDQLR